MTEDIVAEEVEMDDEVEAEDNSIREAFDLAVSEEQAEDDIKMAMIQAGATFKNVTRFYNQFMIDGGFAISKDDRNQIVSDTLEGCDLDSEELFEAAVSALVSDIQGATERSAAALIRSYAKKNELECYTKPKGEAGTRSSFVGDYYSFLIGNPAMTKEEAMAYINGEGDHPDTSDNVKKHASKHIQAWVLANGIINKAA